MTTNGYIEIDLYTSHGGYGVIATDEIIFEIETDKYKKRLRVYDGYFDIIMEYVGLSEDGTWTGLAYYYHCDPCWENGDWWKIPNLEESLSQLKSVNIPDDEVMQETRTLALPEIIKILSEGIEQKVPVKMTLK